VSGGVLAIRPRNLGDVVLVIPALRALRRGHPGAELHVIVDPAYQPLVEVLPEVSRVWAMERTIGGTLRLVLALRALRFEWVVDFFGNPRTALIASRCGAERSAGYDLRGRGRAYRVRVPRSRRDPDGRREYAAATHVRLAAAAGGRPDGVDPRLEPGAGPRARGLALLAAAGLGDPSHAIGLVAAGSWPTKTWPLAHAARLALGLRAAGREVVLLGGPGEERATETLGALVPGLPVLPRCDVLELAGAVAALGAVVGTDSGPRHLAVALGVPTYSWFGPTHPDNWTPDDPRHGYWQTDLPCRGCDRTRCPHWSCLPALHPDQACARVLAHLERRDRTTADLRPAAGA
jgi:ADP-heptose:LPS heptosyltransferase